MSTELASHHLLSWSDVYVHPMWAYESMDYDYALIQLPKPLDFSGSHSHLMPICLPQATDVFENTECVTSGWRLARDSGKYPRLSNCIFKP